jgi:uncharacterized protein YdeI (YjbR/CyaY-like superfamily)
MKDPVMHPHPYVEMKSQAAWRLWLGRHHRHEKGVWLVFRKQAAGGPAFSYESAVEEALCVGWIDSLIRRLDETRYARLFTPRRKGSSWSDLNIGRVRRLIRQGRMAPPGLAAFEPGLLRRPEQLTRKRDPLLPHSLRKTLFARTAVRKNFMQLPPSQRRLYVAWILDAKKEGTRQRRIAEAVRKLEQGVPLGLK